MHNRIKEIRSNAKLTQQEFADRLGIRRGTIANYELGRNEPIDAVITLICREFHVNDTWLRTGEGEMFSQTTLQEQLSAFFGNVLATAPDERSAFIASLADLPPDFWPLVAELAKNIVKKLEKD